MLQRSPRRAVFGAQPGKRENDGKIDDLGSGDRSRAALSERDVRGGLVQLLVSLDQGVQAQWGQVENVYQRRADLVPNLVQTVKGAANFEQETLTAVTEARAQVGKITPDALKNVTSDPEAFARFEKAQGQLSSALSRLLVVAEKYPELKATENFRDLQAQLEGTENRIAVERMRFNEAAELSTPSGTAFPR